MRALAGILLVLALAGNAAGAAAPVLDERVILVPVKVRDADGATIEQDITVTIFERSGRGRYPLLVLNHGRSAANRDRLGRARYSQAAGYFASLGFSVWVPTRSGYGVSGTERDPEYAGPCSDRAFARSFGTATDQVQQVIEFARRRPDIEAGRIVVVGQSYGGASSVALAARNVSGVAAAINFAGGGGGRPGTMPGEPCSPERLVEVFRDYGKSARIPTLWIYTENDLYFGPRHTRAWFDAFRSQGGTGEFMLLPPFGQNGHRLFAGGFDIWRPIVENFLKGRGFPAD